MKGFFNDIWNSLKLSAGNSVIDAASSINLRYRKENNGALVYRNNRAYNDVFIHSAKQTAMQIAEATLNGVASQYAQYKAEKKRSPILKEQYENYTQLISEGESSVDEYGKIWIDDIGKYFFAQDRYGNTVREALILSYIDESMTAEIKFNEKEIRSTARVIFSDLNPTVSGQSGKNVVMTQVQGRDFTRKELVSGNDITFSVQGNIATDQMGVYPEHEVKKFIQIMQYGGLVDINHFLFGQFNVNKIIITEYSLPHPTFKNIQPYSFSCVAVEPNEDVKVYTDTINILNKAIISSPQSSPFDLVLSTKLKQIGANTAIDAASDIATNSLSSLLSNI